MKIFLRYFLLLFVLQSAEMVAQEDRYRSERRRVWKKWRKNRQSYNPYLDKSKKERPSAVMARENAKELKKQKRKAKRQMRRSKKRLNKG